METASDSITDTNAIIEENMNTEKTSMIKLQTSDGIIVSVEREIALMSSTIKGLIDTLDEGEEETIIPLPNVDKKTLDQVIEICKIKEEKQKEEPRTTLQQGPYKFNKEMTEFFASNGADLEGENFLETVPLIKALNYLGIPDKMSTVAARMATVMSNIMANAGDIKVPEVRGVIRGKLGLPKDDDEYTDEEREKVLEEIKWALEKDDK